MTSAEKETAAWRGWGLDPGKVTLSKTGFLFDHITGLTYTLNRTGAFLFMGMLENKPFGELASSLESSFDVDSTVAKRDTEEFINLMRVMGII